MSQPEPITVIVRLKPLSVDEESCIDLKEQEITIYKPCDPYRISTTFTPIRNAFNNINLRQSTLGLGTPSNFNGSPSTISRSSLIRTPRESIRNQLTPKMSNNRDLLGETQRTKLNEKKTPRNSTPLFKRTNQFYTNQTPNGESKTFNFTHIFDGKSQQESLFDYVKPKISSIFKGLNTTIFAYGQTGSGKTFTMMGNKQLPGIIPRSIAEIFKFINCEKSGDCGLYLTYIEIYNNKIYDLLDPGNSEGLQRNSTPYRRRNSTKTYNKIKIVEDYKLGKIFLTGSDYFNVQLNSEEQCFKLLEEGSKRRAVGATNLNEHSSRSHSIVILTLQTRQPNSDIILEGKLNLVDLAGSECAKRACTNGTTLTETKNINSSLSALVDVLSVLSKNHKINNNNKKKSNKKIKPMLVPYRNSKLTRLLKDSLGGNSRTVMITTISQDLANYRTTIMSLRYAYNTTFIKNHVSQNAHKITREKKNLTPQIKSIQKKKKGGKNARTINNKHFLKQIEELKNEKIEQQKKFDLLLIHQKNEQLFSEYEYLNLRHSMLKGKYEKINSQKEIIHQNLKSDLDFELQFQIFLEMDNNLKNNNNHYFKQIKKKQQLKKKILNPYQNLILNLNQENDLNLKKIPILENQIIQNNKQLQLNKENYSNMEKQKMLQINNLDQQIKLFNTQQQSQKEKRKRLKWEKKELQNQVNRLNKIIKKNNQEKNVLKNINQIRDNKSQELRQKSVRKILMKNAFQAPKLKVGKFPVIKK
ncbi:kinesin-like protein kif3a [Anaeramoeba flamelloides]|uniref:Kinesin-like protein n=1 Tax=Anaeramoeba flamelloides TaxID=1746091 RepID=A0ABQ8XC99_9EUKA|nr:kinesin-like protein kif3a [Anaeramoeba flamelloides]